MWNANVFSKRTRSVKSWLPLIQTNLRIASFAINAITTAANKRNCYPIADFPVLNICANFRNHAREFMPRNMWQLSDVRIVALPAVPIAAAKPSGLNLDNYAMGPGHWHIPLTYI